MKGLVIAAALLVAIVRDVAPRPEIEMPSAPCPERTRQGFLESRVRALGWAETQMDVMVKRIDDDTLSAPDRAAAWDTLQNRRLMWQSWETRSTRWVSCSDPCGW